MSKHILEGRRVKIVERIEPTTRGRTYAHGIIISVSGDRGLVLIDAPPYAAGSIRPFHGEIELEDPDALRRELLGEPASKTADAPKRSLSVVEGRRHGEDKNCWAWSVREANGDIVKHGFEATEDEATQAGLLWCIENGVPVVAPESPLASR